MWLTYDDALDDLARMEAELLALGEQVGETGEIPMEYSGLIAVPSDGVVTDYRVFYGRVLNIARVAGFDRAADLWLHEWGHIDRSTGRVRQGADEG